MTMLARRSDWTIDSFLTWEGGQELRYEFNGIEPVAMVGALAGHHWIIRNTEAALQRRLTRCEVFRETMKLRLAHTVRTPDLMVVCSAVTSRTAYVTDPVVVVEVLSESTAQEDRIVKNEEYRLTPAIRQYIMLESDQMAATVFQRVGDDWIGRVVVDGNILIPALSVEVPLSEIYAGVLDDTPA